MHANDDNSIFLQAAEEIEALRDQQLREGNQMIKNNVQKMYQELVNKGNHSGHSSKSLNNFSLLRLLTLCESHVLSCSGALGKSAPYTT